MPPETTETVRRVRLFRVGGSNWTTNPDLPEHLQSRALAALEVCEFVALPDLEAVLLDVVEGLSRANQSAAAFGLVTRLAQAGINLDPQEEKHGA